MKTNDVTKLEAAAIEDAETISAEKQEEAVTFNDLFASTKANYSGNHNALPRTQQLTATAEQVAKRIFEAIQKDPAGYKSQIEGSMKEHGFMDDLIERAYPLSKVDISFLDGMTEDEFEKMLRSQQSKRSRAMNDKGPNGVLSKDSYEKMMVGAIAENLLRIAFGKPKGSGGGGGTTTEIGYSDERLNAFTNDPELLKKEIRNVQSKISIMKSKGGFDINNPDVRFIQLREMEAMLKRMRDTGAAAIDEEAKAAIQSRDEALKLLENAENLPPEEAQALLTKVQNLLASK